MKRQSRKSSFSKEFDWVTHRRTVEFLRDAKEPKFAQTRKSELAKLH